MARACPAYVTSLDVEHWIAEFGPAFGAHVGGVQALEETYFLYLVAKEFDPQRNRCIKWDDPAIAVKWPAPDRAILSQRDRNCPPLAEAENNFTYDWSKNYA